jgi:signal transduction histidine kinase
VILGISNSLHYLNNLPVKTQKQTNIMTTLLKTIEEFKLKIEQNEIQVNINSKDILESENIEIFYTIEEKVLIYLWSVFIDNCIDSLLMKEDLRTINIYIYERKEKIHIAIRDNGIGIPTDIQDELFQPLIKGKKFGGIGMGLFNAKNIIETYNGTISFYSNNELTIFDVTFKKY